MEDPTEDVVENEMRGRIPAGITNTSVERRTALQDVTEYNRNRYVNVILSSIGYWLQIGTISTVLRMCVCVFIYISACIPKVIVQIGLSILQHRLELVSKVQLVIYQPQV